MGKRISEHAFIFVNSFIAILLGISLLFCTSFTSYAGVIGRGANRSTGDTIPGSNTTNTNPGGSTANANEQFGVINPDTSGTAPYVDSNPAIYSYYDMVGDLCRLLGQYPDLIKIESLGKTYDKKDIWHVTVGHENAPKRVLIVASIHAREYITSQLAMKQISTFLQENSNDKSWADQIAFDIIPMANPDGVAISQGGLDGLSTDEAKATVMQIAVNEAPQDLALYFKSWKSNARGIDPNRNFPESSWAEFTDSKGHPSSVSYKGEAPGCCEESAAIVKLMERINPVRAVSLHSQGKVLYWNFGQQGDLLSQNASFVNSIAESTGYTTDVDYSQLSPVGLVNWLILEKGIPSVTIEVGSGSQPLPAEQFESIWAANKNLWNTLISCVQNL